MAVSGLVRLCCIGSDKGDIAALAREDSPTGAALRELEIFPPREGAGPQEEVARKCLLASGLVALRETTRLMTPQPGNGTPPALEEQLPEDVVPRKFFARGYQYEIFSWLRRRGRRLPAVLLPEAVRWAAAGGHEAIRPVLGRAGEQLCRDNPAWRPLLADGAGAAAEQTGGVDLSLWDEASPEVRCRLLQSLRARDPQAGRELAAPLLRRAFSKNRLLLYAGFEPSRDIWCLYIEALRRRTEDCLRWRVMRKVARLDPAWREVFSALWNPELDECTPESFQRWTCRRFRDSHGMTPVLYHVAWEMPLDLLEKFIQTLQLPPAVFLFEDEQTVLDAIERFRAMPVLDAISEFCAMPLRLQDRLVQTWQQSSDASRFQDEQRELDAIRRFRVRAEHAC